MGISPAVSKCLNIFLDVGDEPIYFLILFEQVSHF